MTKIAMIGAGSVVFVKNLLTDILEPARELQGCTIALHDIDAERLDTAGMMARWTAAQFEARARRSRSMPTAAPASMAPISSSTWCRSGCTRRRCSTSTSRRRYGLKQTIADTVGIGGIFRGLRTIPFMLDLVADMRAVCPDALLLNYTNPMSILTWAVYRAFPEQRVVGLCHNVQFTSQDLAEYLGVDVSRLSYECAGINHMTWFLRLMLDGKDAYPRAVRGGGKPGDLRQGQGALRADAPSRLVRQRIERAHRRIHALFPAPRRPDRRVRCAGGRICPPQRAQSTPLRRDAAPSCWPARVSRWSAAPNTARRSSTRW